jgi:tetratricopeptide (TPR) repeat protein
LEWTTLDRWIKLTLVLDNTLKRHDPITLSILWRWLFQTITNHPKSLPHALTFIRETYGEGKGEFCELITNEAQLSILIKRSMAMTNHTFLLEKLMRLIIWHEDSIDDLETLGRFYLNSGHELIALQIFQQLIRICHNAKREIPPAPLAYAGCYLWLNQEHKEARKMFKLLAHSRLSWGSSDAQFLLALDDYRLGRRLNAVQRWKSILTDSKRDKTFRGCIAKALLGEVPPDPEVAGVPDRHDYRFLFYFFVGLRHLIDHQNDNDPKSKAIGVQLFQKMQELMLPSFNIYASTESFARIPLELLNTELPPKPKPEILSIDEKNWIRILIMTIKNEVLQDSP